MLDTRGALRVEDECPASTSAPTMATNEAEEMLAWSEKPLIAVNHVASHIYACRLASQQEIFPCVGLVVSGGHTALFHCRDALNMELLGGTRDDAAGEAFDELSGFDQLSTGGEDDWLAELFLGRDGADGLNDGFDGFKYRGAIWG